MSVAAWPNPVELHGGTLDGTVSEPLPQQCAPRPTQQAGGLPAYEHGAGGTLPVRPSRSRYRTLTKGEADAALGLPISIDGALRHRR